MDLYLPATDAAHICGWSAEELRTMRRALKPTIPVSRPRRIGRGRTEDQLELDAFVKFAERVTGGLDRRTVESLTNASAPLI